MKASRHNDFAVIFLLCWVPCITCSHISYAHIGLVDIFLQCLAYQADVRMAERSKAPDSRLRYLPIVQWGWAFWSPNGGVGSNPTPDNFFLSCHHLTLLACASRCKKSLTGLQFSFPKMLITVISRGSTTC